MFIEDVLEDDNLCLKYNLHIPKKIGRKGMKIKWISYTNIYKEGMELFKEYFLDLWY